MTVITTSNFSGHKASQQAAHSRDQQTKLIEENAMRKCPEFVQLHLSILAGPKADITQKIAQSADAKSKCKVYEESRNACATQMYDDLVDLLNYLSRNIHANLPSGPKTELIEFLDHHAVMPDRHPRYFDMKSFPDIIAVPAFVKMQYDQNAADHCASWHHLLSVVEDKSVGDKKKGLPQCGTYLAYACQARPDIPAMYGLSFSPNGYSILYNDPSGIDYSDEFKLDDLTFLAYYVYALYRPPERHYPRDPSITLASRLFDEPRWNVTFNGRTYRNCSVQFVGAPHKRQTWVAMSENPPSVIKDSWWSYGRNWVEGELFDVLHERGRSPVPGWVQIEAHGKVPAGDPLIPAFLETYFSGMHDPKRKVKRRIVMTSSGDSLSQCGSVLKFLKVMYDVLEAHRFAGTERNILHRDISFNNILINPKGPAPPPLVGLRPKFIDEIVDGTENAPPNALLCDLDNGCEWRRDQARSPTYKAHKKSGENPQKNPERTGTPLYIARSLCSARFSSDVDYEKMPAIPEWIQDKYIKAHTYKTPVPIRAFQDDDGFHGGTKDQALYQLVKEEQRKKWEDRSPIYLELFWHHMHHDAESVYWVIVGFLLLAKPRPSNPQIRNAAPAGVEQNEYSLIAADEEPDDHQAEVEAIWKEFATHKIEESTVAVKHPMKDARAFILEWGPDNWKDVLHVKLAHLGDLLFELSLQVQPEYVYLQPDLDKKHPDHLHEAMQRILLKYIVPMWNTPGIPIYRAIHRTVAIPVNSVAFRWYDGWEPTARGQSHPSTRGSKRNNDSCDDGPRTSKCS